MKRFQNGKQKRQESLLKPALIYPLKSVFSCNWFNWISLLISKEQLALLGDLGLGKHHARNGFCAWHWIHTLMSNIQITQDQISAEWQRKLLIVINKQSVSHHQKWFQALFPSGGFFHWCHFRATNFQIWLFYFLRFLSLWHHHSAKSPKILWPWANNVELQYQITLTWIR